MEDLERIDWTDTLLTEAGKQAVEDILVEYHDTFAKHSMNSGTNPEFKVKLKTKEDNVVFGQNLRQPIGLNKHLTVELGPRHKYGIIRVLPFLKYATPFFTQRKPTENYIFLWISGKSKL